MCVCIYMYKSAKLQKIEVVRWIKTEKLGNIERKLFIKKENSSFFIVLKFFMGSMDTQSSVRSTKGVSFLICTRTSDFGILM